LKKLKRKIFSSRLLCLCFSTNLWCGKSSESGAHAFLSLLLFPLLTVTAFQPAPLKQLLDKFKAFNSQRVLSQMAFVREVMLYGALLAQIHEANINDGYNDPCLGHTRLR